MKRSLVIIGILLLSINVHAQHEGHRSTTESKSQTGKSLSPLTSTMAMVGDAHIHIDYSSPSVRERIIFGGLVGYNTVWQAGAHKATWIETNKNLVIDGKTLPAGKYAFFTVPGKDIWKVMFNSHWDQHGKDEYDEAKNVLVLETEPIKLEDYQEELRYEVTKTGENNGEISLAWEDIKISLPFEVAER